MAETAAVANGGAVENTGAAENPQQAAPQSTWNVVTSVLFRMLMMWMFMSWLRGGGNKTETPATDSTGTPVPVAAPSANLFGQGEMLSLWMFVNEKERMQRDKLSLNELFWHVDEITYGSFTDGPFGDGTYTYNGTIDLSNNVQNNKSLYIHTYLTLAGHVPNYKFDGTYSAQHVVYVNKQLNKYKKRTIKRTQNLLTGKTETDPELLKHAEKQGNIELLSHWHPNLTINLVDDHTPWTKGKIPSPLDKMIHFDAAGMTYEPIVYLNDYWNLLRDFTPINDTVKQVSLYVTVQPMSLFKLQMYISQNMRSQWSSMLGDDYMQDSEQDQDALKEAILETNPYMLGLTVVVSIVHSVFEFLAFKNDIQFWKSRKSLVGLSVRSVLVSVVQSVIVFLYVMDNDTNFVIKVSIFIGCLIDGWKITKVMSVGISMESKWLGFIPRITLHDKSTYVESETKKYDQLAFKYLGMILFPFLIAYAVYSLIYDEHKGVYSYILSMLYGFLLTFGFIMMTPQLFINYKMKSVAHLPWRMLTYKALNTFIDDIFAFVIKMPTLYRIGCFRDDVVFFIYLYQRYTYRIDPKRVNEFGTSGENPDAPAISEPSTTPEALPSTGDKKND
ncbi:putative lipid scramblase CLPTM1 [Ciona intestinalis]